MPPFDFYPALPQSIAEQIQEKNSFDWFYSPEPGLFNPLRRFQAKNSLPSQAMGGNVSDRIVLGFSALPQLARAAAAPPALGHVFRL